VIGLSQAAAHVRLHRGRILVLKIGGACLEPPAVRAEFVRQVAAVHALGALPVVVHGGGPQTGRLQETLGEKPRLVDGRRITSPVALRALRLALLGELNPELAAALTAAGAPAVGLCGASANLLLARRRCAAATSRGTTDFGEVGGRIAVDPRSLHLLLGAGFLPVVAPPAADGRGGFLNVNADLAAAELATALGAAKLILLTDAPGILRVPDDPASLVSALSLDGLGALEKRGALRGGMKVKAAAIRRALDGGVERVHVVPGRQPGALLEELYTTQGHGTLITREEQRIPEEVAAG